ncbi:MAG: hypothetical protein IKX24_07400, partial [Prevotella sp.]|nr:hypothetical protein [Prevotella sp.]
KFPLFTHRRKFLAKKITAIAIEYGNFGHEQYKNMVYDSLNKGTIVHMWKTAIYYFKLKFWCFLVSPRATWPSNVKFSSFVKSVYLKKLKRAYFRFKLFFHL